MLISPASRGHVFTGPGPEVLLNHRGQDILMGVTPLLSDPPAMHLGCPLRKPPLSHLQRLLVLPAQASDSAPTTA